MVNPLRGTGPEALKIDSLVARILRATPPIREVILALSTTLEGDATTHYIVKELSDCSVTLSTIARGVPAGSALEYTDDITLKRSLQDRIHYAPRSVEDL